MPARTRYDEPREVTFRDRMFGCWGLGCLTICALGLGIGLRALFKSLEPPPPVPRKSPTARPPAEPVKAAPRALFSMDETFSVGTTEWNIIEARDMGTVLKSSNMWAKDVQGKNTRFVSIEGRVVNRGEKTVFFRAQLQASDAAGKTYPEMIDVGFYLPYWLERLAPRELAPKVMQSFGAIFEVPENATGLRFVAVDLAAPKETGCKLVDITPEREAEAEAPPQAPPKEKKPAPAPKDIEF